MTDDSLDRLFAPLDRIPGPEFLALYLALLVGAFLVTTAVAIATRPKPSREPSLFEVAALAQGLDGVVVASHLLADQPAAAVPATGHVTYTAADASLHARIQAARPRLAGQSATEQAASPELAPALAELWSRLRADGFLRPDSKPVLRTTRLVFLALLAFALVRVWRGFENDRPSDLLALLMVGVFFAWFFAGSFAQGNPHVERMLKRLRLSYGMRGRKEPGTAPLPVAYALGGGVLLWALAPTLAGEYQVSLSSLSASTSGASSCGGSSGGGGDGGGGDGGGGCGGCGGGD